MLGGIFGRPEEWENAMSRGNNAPQAAVNPMSAGVAHSHGVLPQQLSACENAKNQGDLALSRGAFEEAYKCFNHALNLVPSGVNAWTHLARETIATLMCSRAEACLKISETQQKRSKEWFNTIRLTHTNCMEALSMESGEVPFSGQLKFRIITQKNQAERLLAETQPCQNKRRSSSQDVPEDLAQLYAAPSFIQSTAGFNTSAVAEPEIKKKQRKGAVRSSRTHLTFSGTSTPSQQATSTRTYQSFSGPTTSTCFGTPSHVQSQIDQEMC